MIFLDVRTRTELGSRSMCMFKVIAVVILFYVIFFVIYAKFIMKPITVKIK